MDSVFLQYAVPVSAIITLFLSVNILFMRWLSNKFRYYEDLAHAIERSAYTAMEKHEANDQARHEENLHRFEKISVALARLGSSNGTYNKKEI